MPAKLNLNFKYLDSLFDVRLAEKVICLKDDNANSLNAQQLYNWYNEKWAQSHLMSHEVPFEGCGFYGLQPIIKIVNGYTIEIPEVERFTVRGLITTEKPGEFPFIVNPKTALVMSLYARPHDKVFLSHSSKDKEFVRALRGALYPICETFFDETDIYPGQSITKRLDEELSVSNALALIYSKNAAESDWVRKEWAAMMHLKKLMLVVRIDEHPLLPLLRDIKYIQYEGDIKKVVSEISSALGAH